MAAEGIQRAFSDSPDLAVRVRNAYVRCENDSELSQIFVDIAAHVQHLSSSDRTAQHNVVVGDPHSKKRKLEANGAPAQPTASDDLRDLAPVFECKDVSFAIPARKKMKLELLASSDKRQGQIRLVDSKTNQVEYTLSGKDIEQAICLPVPDKAQRQQNYVIIPSGDSGLEQIVFTMNEAADKTGAVVSRSTSSTDDETLATITTKELAAFLTQQSKKLTLPDEREFASSIPQSNRKGEKAYHVKAFRGSKDGYLFFLPTGIFFGFKKPLLFFSFADVDSISYTSVLQRTFNLVITPPASDNDDALPQDIEFSMLDQADFAGIDEYIKAHGLNDASMAADRRAKMYNVNKEPKSENGNGETVPADAEDGQNELGKAEQQIQDEEDELEEDYDPSGGESDGEGEDSGEEEQEETYADDEGYDDEGEEEDAVDGDDDEA